MTRDDPPRHPDADGPEPPLPPEFPEPPDPARVRALRSRLDRDRGPRRPAPTGDGGSRARDIGAYTLIPMMMLAGPAVGYGLGILIERNLGGAPWASVGGILFGLAAAFRQIFLLLARRRPPGD